jgi:RsiW-degrading membrane proteinase PrsW (M82 family)
MRFESASETEPAWGQTEPLWQPHRPAFWLFVGLAVIGLPVIFHRVLPALNVDIGASSLAFVSWALYAVPFLALVVALDLLEPEPPAFLATAFAWGAIVAVSIAIVANDSLLAILAKVADPEFSRDWGPAIAGASTEEALKALGIIVVILIAARQMNTVLDGFIYGAVVGLAFQVSEDFVYTADRISLITGGRAAGGVVLDVLLLRGVGLGLWSHAVWTAIVGAGIAYYKVATDRSKTTRLAVAVGLFLSASMLHFFWNTPWWGRNNPGSLSSDDIPVFLIKGIPAFVLVLVLWGMARRRDVAWFQAALGNERSVVKEDELVDLETMRGRHRAVRADRRKAGARAGRLRGDLQRAQVRLAVEVARVGCDAPETNSARQAVLAIRDELDRELVSGVAS